MHWYCLNLWMHESHPIYYFILFFYFLLFCLQTRQMQSILSILEYVFFIEFRRKRKKENKSQVFILYVDCCWYFIVAGYLIISGLLFHRFDGFSARHISYMHYAYVSGVVILLLHCFRDVILTCAVSCFHYFCFFYLFYNPSSVGLHSN